MQVTFGRGLTRRLKVEKFVGAGLDAEAHFGDVAQPDEFAFALFEDGEEDVGCAEVFAAPFIADVAGGLNLYRCKFVGASGSTPTRLGLRGRRPSNGRLRSRPYILLFVGLEAFFEELALRADADAPLVGDASFSGGLDLFERRRHAGGSP